MHNIMTSDYFIPLSAIYAGKYDTDHWRVINVQGEDHKWREIINIPKAVSYDIGNYGIYVQGPLKGQKIHIKCNRKCVILS